jgi:hypothetical protein
VSLGPVEAAPHIPHVDEIPHQVEILRFGGLEEVEKIFGTTALESQVHIGYPYRSKFFRSKMMD